MTMQQGMETWVSEPCVEVSSTLLSFYSEYSEMLRKVTSSKKAAMRASSMIKGLDEILDVSVQEGKIGTKTQDHIVDLLASFLGPMVNTATLLTIEQVEAAEQLMATLIAEEIIACQCGISCQGKEQP